MLLLSPTLFPPYYRDYRDCLKSAQFTHKMAVRCWGGGDFSLSTHQNHICFRVVLFKQLSYMIIFETIKILQRMKY